MSRIFPDSDRTAGGAAAGGPVLSTAIFLFLCILKALMSAGNAPVFGRKRTCVRHVGEAASQPIWASRRLRSRVRAVLGPENKSPGSY